VKAGSTYYVLVEGYEDGDPVAWLAAEEVENAS
jgi:hypothetical protein